MPRGIMFQCQSTSQNNLFSSSLAFLWKCFSCSILFPLPNATNRLVCLLFQNQIPQTGSIKVGSTSGPAVTTATGATVAGVSSSGSTLAAATSNSSITGAAGNSVGAGKSWSSVTSGNKNTGELGGQGTVGDVCHV